MAKITILFGVLLIILGGASYVLTGLKFPTSLIPVAFGILLVTFGTMAETPSSAASHALHAHCRHGGPARLPGHRPCPGLRGAALQGQAVSRIRRPLKKKQQCRPSCSSMYYSVCVPLLRRAAPGQSRGPFQFGYAIQRRGGYVYSRRTVKPFALGCTARRG